MIRVIKQLYFDILSIERLNVFQKRSNIVIKMIIKCSLKKDRKEPPHKQKEVV